MKKNILFVALIILFFSLPIYALNANEIKNRNVCSKFEVAVANSDGSVTSLSCYENFSDAKAALKEDINKDTIIFERVSNVTKIVDAKYGLLYLDRGDINIDVYSSASFNNAITYMNNYYKYGAVDAALIDINVNNKGAKMRISGVTGWIKNNTYTIFPVAWVKSYSYYNISNSEIKHYYVKTLDSSGVNSSRKLGPKPVDIDAGNYVSYDGIYFYKDLYTMIDDYKKGNYNNSVNPNGYYNYYMYLPHRSKTNYSVDELDVYIRNVLNKKSSLYGNKVYGNSSALFGTSDFFMINESLYGANGISMFSLASNESARGTSDIAAAKNNIFGHNAYDNNPFASASGYINVFQGIRYHAYTFINYGYADLDDERYYGTHYGNKFRGMNLKYASDPYWGEKAASYYYLFDESNGLEDYNFYQLVLSLDSDVNVRRNPTTNSSSIHKIKYTGLPFILLEEVHGEKINGSDIWYKIQLDPVVDDNGNVIKYNKNKIIEYNWNGYGYVHSSYLKKINESFNEDGKYHSTFDTKEDDIDNYSFTNYFTKDSYLGTMVKIKEDCDAFYTSSLVNKRTNLVKDSIVLLILSGSDGVNTRYLVLTDLEKFQFSWIDASYAEIVDVDTCSFKLAAGKTTSLLDLDNNVVANIYNSNILALVDTVSVNDKTYLKLMYKVSDEIKYGYIDSKNSTITYTLNYVNKKPVITSSDLEFYIMNEYNLLDGVKALDYEDGDLTKEITYESNIDINIPGNYFVRYRVCDSKNECVIKENKVVVKAYIDKNGLFMYDSFVNVSDNTFKVSGYLGINGINNVNCKHSLIFVNEFDNKEYVFNLDNWKDYPYEMASLNDKVKYDNSGGWFNSNLDLSSLPNGNYKIYVNVINNGFNSRVMFTNIAFMPIIRRFEASRGYSCEIDYSSNEIPLVFSIRDSLISSDIPISIDPMYNFFNDISLNENILTLVGTSHNFGVDMSKDKNVERYIIFENKNSFERFSFELGSITDGDYDVVMAQSDNFDKTRAWFKNSIDISSLTKGDYIVYLSNTVDEKTYYGEVIDVSFRDFSLINNSKFEFYRNDDVRLRIELKVN